MAEDAAAGLDVPQAGLFVEKAREQGQELGIRYVTVAEVRRALAAGT